MKLITVVGARPQLIKEAVLQKELRLHTNIEHIKLVINDVAQVFEA